MPPQAALLSPANRRIAVAGAAAAAVCAAAVALSSVARASRGPASAQQQQQQPGMEGLSRFFSGGGGGAAGSGGGGARQPTGQDRLVNYLIASDLVKTERVEHALRAVDRKKFVDAAYAPLGDAYQDTPLPIGYGQTISAPHMHAICLELLERHLVPGARALDVGSGSGYLAAAMALMVSPGGSVLGVEKVPELASRSVRDIAAAVPGLLPDRARAGEGRRPSAAAATVAGEGGAVAPAGPAPPLEIVHGNVLSDMLRTEPPFDVIHVGAAADELHAALVDALAPGGRMVIPIGPRYASQVLTIVDKARDGTVARREMMHVGYVPLTRPSEVEDGFARVS